MCPGRCSLTRQDDAKEYAHETRRPPQKRQIVSLSREPCPAEPPSLEPAVYPFGYPEINAYCGMSSCFSAAVPRPLGRNPPLGESAGALPNGVTVGHYRPWLAAKATVAEQADQAQVPMTRRLTDQCPARYARFVSGRSCSPAAVDGPEGRRAQNLRGRGRRRPLMPSRPPDRRQVILCLRPIAIADEAVARGVARIRAIHG